MVKQKQKRKRRSHTAEFKAETVKLVRDGGRSVGQVCSDLDLADRGQPGAQLAAAGRRGRR